MSGVRARGLRKSFATEGIELDAAVAVLPACYVFRRREVPYGAG